MTTTPTVRNTSRLILMTMGKLLIACRIETVYKVVSSSKMHSTSHMGVVHVDNRPLVVSDLYPKLFNTSIPAEPEYFVIVSSMNDDLVGIPVLKSPNLIDVPRERIKTLPASYRQTDTLRIVSHVVMLQTEKETSTIFVIDENTLL